MFNKANNRSMSWKLLKIFKTKNDESDSGAIRQKQPTALDAIRDAMADGLDRMSHALRTREERPPCCADICATQSLPLDKSSFACVTVLGMWSVDSTLPSSREPPRQAAFNQTEMDQLFFIISKIIIHQLLKNSFFGMEHQDSEPKIIYEIKGCNITNVGGQIQTQNNQIANDLRKQTAHVGGEAEEAADSPANNGRPAVRRGCGGRVRSLFKDNSTLLRERKRFLDYLHHHHLSSRRLSCKRDDLFNDVTVCFLLTWKERRLLSEDAPSGGAVFRFLTTDCGLASGVSDKSYANKIKEKFQKKRFTLDNLRQVRSFFQEHSSLAGE